MKLYSKVCELRTHGLSYNNIRKIILKEERTRLSKSVISDWTRGIHNPDGKLNRFIAKSTPELAYVIGVILSDGNLNIHGYSAEMILAVSDYDFAQEFSRCLARVLQKEQPYKVRWHERKKRWVVQGSSILLYNFLHSDWNNLKRWVEASNNCRAAFLRAFYDGEGCVSGRTLTVSNTRRQLLAYIQHLLEKLRIETSPVCVYSRAGTKLTDPKTGRTYFRKNDCYGFRVRSGSLPRFKQSVGFTIGRKQTALLEACLEVRETFRVSR